MPCQYQSGAFRLVVVVVQGTVSVQEWVIDTARVELSSASSDKGQLNQRQELGGQAFCVVYIRILAQPLAH